MNWCFNAPCDRGNANSIQYNSGGEIAKLVSKLRSAHP